MPNKYCCLISTSCTVYIMNVNPLDCNNLLSWLSVISLHLLTQQLGLPSTSDLWVYPLPSSCLLLNLAEMALFEREYSSWAWPKTKLEHLYSLSSYVWPSHQLCLLSLSLPSPDDVWTWSVLLIFSVLFYYSRTPGFYIAVRFFDFYICACVTCWSV